MPARVTCLYRQGRRLALCTLIALALGSCASPFAPPSASEAPRADPATPAKNAARNRLAGALAQSPLSFIPNRGQLDSRVAYYAVGGATTLYFTSQGITFALGRPDAQGAAEGQDWQRWAFNQQFLGARAGATPVAQQPTATVVSYFKGPRSRWQANLPTYESLAYAELWPGIDLVFAGAPNRLKYTFVVKPGADPRQIAWAYDGISAARVAEDGRLELTTPAGTVSDDRPYAYQTVNGQQVAVDASYALDGRSARQGGSVGFRLGAYDPTKALLIDPAVLVYGSYFGGASYDAGSAIAIDGAGNAYVTGATFSSEATFPVAPGPDRAYNGSVDAFVAKISADGSRLLYAGYLGGAAFDQGSGIAVDAAGNAYLTGQTQSSETSFPVAGGPDLIFNGGVDAFVAKIAPDGSRLLYAGYLGGAGFDQGSGIAVDAAGNAYLTGQTQSSETSFPVAGGPDLTFNGGVDAFVAKVAPDGLHLLYAGYVGGSGSDAGAGIALGADGSAYLTGSTSSSSASFPASVGPDLTFNGGVDAFVAKVAPDGSHLLYAGYLGGSDYDAGASIAVDAAGNAFIAGETQSTASSFPAKIGPDLTLNGGIDAFVAKVAADGTALVYAGYVGGKSNDGATGIALGSTGIAYLVGTTASSDATFPLVGGPDLSYNGGSDGFLAKISADGKRLIYAGYLGGAGDDEAAGLAVDATGDAYVAGFTGSPETSFPASNGADTSFNGDRDAFVLRLATAPDLQVLASAQPSPVFPSLPLTYTLSVSSADALKSDALGVVLTDTLPATVDLVSITPSQGHCSGTSQITCELGQLSSGASATVTIVVIPQRLGTIRNTASVTGTEPEPNMANNSATLDTPVVVLSYLPLVVR